MNCDVESFDMAGIAPAGRVMLLGAAFREIPVKTVAFTADSTMLVTCLLNGREVVLAGDPERALAVWLAGTAVETLQ